MEFDAQRILVHDSNVPLARFAEMLWIVAEKRIDSISRSSDQWAIARGQPQSSQLRLR